MIRKLQFCFLKTMRLFERRRKTALLTLGVFILVLSPGFLRIKQLLAIEDYLSPEFKGYHELEVLKREFPDHLNVTANFLKRSGLPFSSTELCQIHQWVSHVSMVFPEVASSYSVFSWRTALVSERRLVFPRILDPCEPGASLELAKDIPSQKSLFDLKTPSLTIQLEVDYSDIDERSGQKFHPEAFWAISKDTDTYWKRLDPKQELHINWVGDAAFESYMNQGILESQWINLLSFAVIMLFFLWAFGTWRSGLIFFSSLVLTYGITYEIMGWLGIPIDQLTSCLPIFILIATLEDFVYLSFHRQKHLGAHWRSSFRAVITPSFWTSLTTFIGFGSLLVSGLTVIRKFGGICALGSMIEWVILFFFIPLVLESYPSLQNWVRATPRSNWISTLGTRRLIGKIPSRVLLLIVLIAPFLVKSIPIRDHPEEIFPKSHVLRQAMQSFFDTRSILTAGSVVFTPDATDVKKERVLALLKASPLVTELESGKEEGKYLTRQLPEDLKAATLDFWRESPPGKRLFSPHGYERILVYMNSSDHSEINRLAEQVRATCGEVCFPAGVIFSYSEFSSAVFKTLFESLFLSIGLVALVILFLCRQYQIKQSAFLILASFWGASVILSFVSIFQFGINFASCIFFSVLAGITGDNTIQFIFGRELSRTSSGLKTSLDHLGGGAILVSLAMILASGTLLFSPFSSIRHLVLLMLAGFAASLIGDLWLLRGLLKND